MIQAFSTSRNRVWSLIYFAICGILAVVAFIPGISHNPPNLVLAILSASALILVFAHPWRTSKQFLYLLFSSVLGFIVSVIFHNVFAAIATKFGSSGIAYELLNGIGVLFFFIAPFICPACMLVGIMGAIIMGILGRHSSSPK